MIPATTSGLSHNIFLGLAVPGHFCYRGNATTAKHSHTRQLQLVRPSTFSGSAVWREVPRVRVANAMPAGYMTEQWRSAYAEGSWLLLVQATNPCGECTSGERNITYGVTLIKPQHKLVSSLIYFSPRDTTRAVGKSRHLSAHRSRSPPRHHWHLYETPAGYR